jgi:hypothetical protein
MFSSEKCACFPTKLVDIWLTHWLISLLVLASSTVLVPEDPEAEMEEETHALLTSDFEIGHYIRERIVPRAVLYYTGKKGTGM